MAFDLVVAAEDEGIARAAAEIRAMGAEITDVRVDLGTAEGVEELSQAQVAAAKILPDTVTASLHATMSKPGSGKR